MNPFVLAWLSYCLLVALVTVLVLKLSKGKGSPVEQ